MMNISKRSYKELAIPYFKEVFVLIDQAMNENEIPYYLIGVNAISLELLKSGVKPSRGTKDIDFAVMLATIDLYDKLSDSLIQKGFNKVKAPWTFYTSIYNIAIDILPFGQLEQKDTQHFFHRKTDIHLLGFKEVLEESNTIKIEHITVNIPPLPGMIILKLVSWSDRPEERENDLADILMIIDHYFDHFFDEIIKFHVDLFTEDFNKYLISAEVLGREARLILNKSDILEKRIINLLESQIYAGQQSKIARNWAIKKSWDITFSQKVISAFRNGLNPYSGTPVS